MAGHYYEPTKRERSALTRIYGDEENWNGVITQPAKARRSIKNSEAKKAMKARKNGNGI